MQVYSVSILVVKQGKELFLKQGMKASQQTVSREHSVAEKRRPRIAKFLQYMTERSRISLSTSRTPGIFPSGVKFNEGSSEVMKTPNTKPRPAPVNKEKKSK